MIFGLKKIALLQLHHARRCQARGSTQQTKGMLRVDSSRDSAVERRQREGNNGASFAIKLS